MSLSRRSFLKAAAFASAAVALPRLPVPAPDFSDAERRASLVAAAQVPVMKMAAFVPFSTEVWEDAIAAAQQEEWSIRALDAAIRQNAELAA